MWWRVAIKGRQGGVGLEEQVFVRAGIGQGELDASHGVDDFGAELQKFQAYGIGDGLGQGRLFQGDAADTVDEDIGEGGEEQAKLVGFVGVCAHAIGKQIELAVLDTVFHVAAWAIGVFVEFPGRDLMAIEGSDEEAAALFVSGLVFDLGDDAPWPGPGSGFGDVVEIAVGADRLAGFDHGYGGFAADPLCFLEQDIVARQAEDVIHGISFAPTHQVLAREAAVAAQQDVDVGPSFADHPDDAFADHPDDAFADHPDDAADLVARTPGAIDVGGSELGEQEMAAAEDIEGQETAVFVIAVEEGVLLAPMGFHVGGVDIEGDARAASGGRRETG